jgi:hypothetical protein
MRVKLQIILPTFLSLSLFLFFVAFYVWHCWLAADHYFVLGACDHWDADQITASYEQLAGERPRGTQFDSFD